MQHVEEGEDLDAAEANWKLEPLERLSPRQECRFVGSQFVTQRIVR